MFEEALVRHCSPTRAGMKTGNLFTCSFTDNNEMKNSIRQWNRTLGKKGLRVMPLRSQNNRALVYVYRPSRLSIDLRRDEVLRILRMQGYGGKTPGRCIGELTKRLKGSKEFPHEIGLFLGYPPEDVRGFIEHGAAECKCAGCWKVYGDADAAEKLFAKYKQCTQDYCALFAAGRSVERLAVAV